MCSFVISCTFSAQDSKSALYWSVEKGNATMVRDILQCNPDTEAYTKVQPKLLICSEAEVLQYTDDLSYPFVCVILCFRKVRLHLLKLPK